MNQVQLRINERAVQIENQSANGRKAWIVSVHANILKHRHEAWPENPLGTMCALDSRDACFNGVFTAAAIFPQQVRVN
jgi:hypothetical protein